MGLKLLAAVAAATALATPAGYVAGQQREDGGFGDAQITAWATLGLVAAGEDTRRCRRLSREAGAGVGDRPRARGDGPLGGG